MIFLLIEYHIAFANDRCAKKRYAVCMSRKVYIEFDRQAHVRENWHQFFQARIIRLVTRWRTDIRIFINGKYVNTAPTDIT